MPQLDLFNPTGPRSETVPGWGRMIVTEGGAWMAKYVGPRWGWVLYRQTTAGWETFEPDLPFGQDRIHDRDTVETVLVTTATRYGDTPLRLR